MLASSATIIMWFFALPHPLTIPFVTGISVVTIGVVMTEWIRPIYAVWNNKVAHRVALITRPALMTICYFIVFLVVAQAGARFTRNRPRSMRTNWTRRANQPEVTGSSLSPTRLNDPADRGWATAYFIWARRTGNWWAIVLLPFLFLLSVLAEDDRKTLPGHIYTLF
jgi:hypothetical protein